MKNIWITGSKGFIGSQLCKVLNKKKYNVFGIGSCRKFNPEKVSASTIKFIEGKINSINLQKIYNYSGKPDVIFHLAGSSSVGQSIIDPFLDYQKTVLSTSNLLEFARKNNLNSKIIFASSAAVYGNNYNNPIKEGDTCSPFSPYGFNKYIAERIIESYSTNFKMDSVVVRFFSIYGVNAKKQLIWDICQKLKTNESSIVLYGNGNEIRDWIYIKDAVNLLIMASNFYSKGSQRFEIFNGSAGFHHTVKEIVKKVSEKMELYPIIKFNNQVRKGDPISLIGNSMKTEKLLKFRPNYDIDNGITKYVEWFKENNL